MDNQPYYFMKNPEQNSNVFDMFATTRRVTPAVNAPVKGVRSIRSKEYYADAARRAVAQGQKDVGEALAREPDTLSIKSWLMSTNPNDVNAMPLQTKIIIGAVAIGAFMLFMKRK